MSIITDIADVVIRPHPGLRPTLPMKGREEVWGRRPTAMRAPEQAFFNDNEGRPLAIMARVGG